MAHVLDCLILGDSIAVGISKARPARTTTARGGIGSAAFLQTMFPASPKAASRVVISLGVNDDASAATLANLRRLRGGVVSNQVTWLLPGLKETVRQHIRTVAEEHGDRLVDTISQVGPDHLHPGRDGYSRIAGWTETGTGPSMPAPASSAAPAVVPFQGRSIASAPLPLRPAGLPAEPTAGAIFSPVSISPVNTGPFAAVPPAARPFRPFTGLRPLMIGHY